jgi:hypothetical protein
MDAWKMRFQVWNGSIWFRVGTADRPFGDDNEPLFFKKGGEFLDQLSVGYCWLLKKDCFM